MSIVPSAPVPVPQRTQLPPNDPRTVLVENVQDALRALPIYFASRTAIEGLEAGDLFSLNSVLGGSIEIQTVNTLNKIRDVWDPDNAWPEYGFERTSQTFPDVRLISRSAGKPSPILGVELKGWYLLSKEGEPSFRYTATRDACSEFDLLVVVPWHLTNVLSGTPIVYEPYIEQARYAADFRNFYWQQQRPPGSDTGIKSPSGVTPYPPPKTRIADRAVQDSGRNFGRVARVKGLMEEYVESALSTRISGIEARHWVGFFETYSDAAKADQVAEKVAKFLARHTVSGIEEEARQVIEHIRAAQDLLAGSSDTSEADSG